MRLIISGSGLVVIIILVILINSSIINKNVRDTEINDGLEIAMDYALDELEAKYVSAQYNNDAESESVDALMKIFCESINEIVSTDGIVIVKLLNSNIENGYFHILVEEQYSYGVSDKTAKCVCERIVVFI